MVPLGLSAGYYAQNRDDAADPSVGKGLFNGDNTIFGQLSFKPNKAIGIGLTYAHAYQSNRATSKLLQETGSITANKPFANNVRSETNNYGIEASLQPSAKLTLGGWAGYTTASTLTGTPNSTDIWYWATSLAVKDFGKEGNVLGLIFGQPPKATGGHRIKGETGGTSYHLEGLYKVKVSDHIQVTPGVLVIFNPENNDKNSTEYVGTLRTTFSF